MWVSVTICAITIVVMIAGILYFPKITFGKVSLASYWIVAACGATALIATGQVSFDSVCSALTANTAINPLKILVLFISMTILSIFLDEMGFFKYLADRTLKHAGHSQKKLFVYLYLIVSVLTVFTSNDIIILSFTPFICYFAKNARINAIPYLAAEFVAANTWSMALIIGNPTNIYIGTAYGVDFVKYVQVMALPTLLAGGVSLLALYLMFRKSLSQAMEGHCGNVHIDDKVGLFTGLTHLVACTLVLAFASYVGIEMWIVAACAVISLFIVCGILTITLHHDMHLLTCLKRAPWELAPFLLSMFVLTMALNSAGVTGMIAGALGDSNSGSFHTILYYGAASFLGANLINNIPMSVLFCDVIGSAAGASGNVPDVAAVFSTIIGSNIGAFLTPIGALAGIMWSTILNHHGFSFGYKDFLKIGILIAVPTLLAALIGLTITL